MMPSADAVVIGGGPAGLMAAEALLDAGHSVAVYDAMPSLGRKFLLAGIGGLNITHAEEMADFCQRYGARAALLGQYLHAFGPQHLREWMAQLGISSFVGSSGRVFPTEMKAAPLLRAWLTRLRRKGLQIHPRHRWQGWHAPGVVRIEHAAQEHLVAYRALVLALGGASWPRLGSDAAWVPLLRDQDIPVAALQPANCGFHCSWSEHLQAHAGEPVKSVALRVWLGTEPTPWRKGEFILAQYGVEGGLIYALSALIRDQITPSTPARLELDLLPDLNHERIVSVLRGRGKQSLGPWLERRLKLVGVKKTLLFEHLARAQTPAPEALAALIKALPLQLDRPCEIDQAISTAGGVCFEAMTAELMLRQVPGVFCAGEMLDWEAPTGGYLLSACFSTGRAAGQGAAAYLRQRDAGSASGSTISIT